MRLKKRFVLLATAAMAAASLMAVPSAQASTAEVNCAFDGLAGNISPGVRALLTGIQGGGTYTFGGQGLACTYVDSDGDAETSQNVTIDSRGSFENIVCSTGTATGNTANGSTTITANDNPNVPQVTQVDYVIAFVGGQGTLAVTKVNGQTAAGGGLVQIRIRPQNPESGNCVTTDVTAFDVTGTFSAVLPTQGT